MGQKINPIAMRMGITEEWKSRWYTDDKNLYRKQLHQDIKIREYLKKRLGIAGLERIEILRSSNILNINVYVARPGVAIGRGGEGIDLIKRELSRKFQQLVEVKIHEVKKSEMSAKVIARSIVEGMERRRSPKRLMTAERDKAMTAGAKGIKIWISGTFGVPKQSRTIKVEEGVVPLQTLRAALDYASDTAHVRNAGLHGIKVWVYRGGREDENRSDLSVR